jgi:hypothetical protein
VLRVQLDIGGPFGLPAPRLRGGQLAHAAAEDVALSRRAIYEGDAEDMLKVVADVVAKARVVTTTFEDITGLNVAWMANLLRHQARS